MKQYINNTPTLIESRDLRILILASPSDDSLADFVQDLKDYNVTDLVRTCEKNFNERRLTELGITLHELSFVDGLDPPKYVVKKWLKLLKKRFVKKRIENGNDMPKKGTIAVLCAAGLGRAPVLAGVGLIESGMTSLDAIEFIRSNRKGALSRIQAEFLLKYKPTQKLNSQGCSIF